MSSTKATLLLKRRMPHQHQMNSQPTAQKLVTT